MVMGYGQIGELVQCCVALLSFSGEGNELVRVWVYILFFASFTSCSSKFVLISRVFEGFRSCARFPWLFVFWQD